jgi:hypothetical protein
VPPGQVVVRRVPGAKIGKDQGETAVYTDSKFVVFINQSREFQNQISILLHEWAHLLTWFEYGDVSFLPGSRRGVREDHTAEWGVVYARIYREHDRWNYGRKRKEEKNE